MPCHNHLRNRRHPHCVASDEPEIFVFRRRLVRRARASDINALLEVYVQFRRDNLRFLDELKVVGPRHVRKSWTEIVEILPDERIWKEVNVVADDHEVTDLEPVVHSSSRIGNEKILYSKHFHYADRESDKFHRVAFIVVETPLHGNDELSSEFSRNEISLVTDCRRHRKSRNFPVRDDNRVLNLVGKLSKPAAKHYSHNRFSPAELYADVLGSTIDSFYSFVHNDNLLLCG